MAAVTKNRTYGKIVQGGHMLNLYLLSLHFIWQKFRKNISYDRGSMTFIIIFFFNYFL